MNTTRTATLVIAARDNSSPAMSGAARAARYLARELEGLQSKSARIDGFRQASRALDDAGQRFRYAQQNVRKLAAEMAGSESPTRQATQALARATREAESAGNAFKAQGAKVREMRAALAEAGIPLNALNAAERELKSKVEATTAALARQKQAVAELARQPRGATPHAGGVPLPGRGTIHVPRSGATTGGSEGGSNAGMAAAGAGLMRMGIAAIPVAGATYAITEGFRRAGREAISFERTMIEVAKATNAKGKDLEVYSEGILKLARETGKSKEELGEMLASAGFAGRPAAELMRFTKYAAQATVAWRTSAEDTGQALAEIGNIFEADQKRIEEIGDAINTMADSSASKESDLIEFMRRGGASSRAVGIKPEEMIAFGAVMKEVGVRTETAATAYEALLNVMKLGDKFSKKAGDGIKSLGLDPTKMRREFTVKPVETMIDVLTRLNKVRDPLKRAEIMTDMFGKEYQDDIQKLINGLPKIREYVALMRDRNKIAAGGVAGQFAENIGKDVSKIDQSTQAIDVLMTRLGEKVKERLGERAKGINEIVEHMETSANILQRLMAEHDAYRKEMDGNEPGSDEPAPWRKAITSAGNTVVEWLLGKKGQQAKQIETAQNDGKQRALAEKEVDKNWARAVPYRGDQIITPDQWEKARRATAERFDVRNFGGVEGARGRAMADEYRRSTGAAEQRREAEAEFAREARRGRAWTTGADGLIDDRESRIGRQRSPFSRLDTAPLDAAKGKIGEVGSALDGLEKNRRVDLDDRPVDTLIGKLREAIGLLGHLAGAVNGGAGGGGSVTGTSYHSHA